jgi:SAM-dependent methyltransferase
MNCRFCGKALTHEFIDLANAPPSNSFLVAEQLNEPEVFFPLKLYVCDSCFLVQADEYKKSSDIFNSEYVYFSSFSRTWLTHAKQYVDMMIEKYAYNQNSKIIEIASNDGYLLQYFEEKGIPSIGIEPAERTALEARKKGIETIVDFFGKRLAKSLADKGEKADLLLGNNVLAHVPDLNDFVAGLKIALKPSGVITMEFPHLMQLIDNCQFDTIYHEHFSYLSFMTVRSIFKHHGLELFDVEELSTHGGSLRIFARHAEDITKGVSEAVDALQEKEISRGLDKVDYYQGFQEKADRIRYDLLQFLIEQKKNGRLVAAYGAAAKGNTLLNYCGVKKDLVAFVADASPYKQGKYLPGSHVPINSEEALKRYKPHYVLILPWNIKEEITAQLDYIREWGGKFVVPIPYVGVVS